MQALNKLVLRGGSVPEEEGTIPAVLSWASELPLWHQDALRRLVVQGGLSEADKAELVGIVLQWAEFLVSGAVTFLP